MIGGQGCGRGRGVATKGVFGGDPLGKHMPGGARLNKQTNGARQNTRGFLCLKEALG